MTVWLTECRRLGLPGEARTWNHALFNLRKRGRLAGIPTKHRTDIEWHDCDDFLFASEIAWKKLIAEGHAKSLDDILCDPSLAREFDGIAHSFAPDFGSLKYRLAALKLRKTACRASTRAKLLKPDKLQNPMSAFKAAIKHAPELAGVYLVSTSNENLYVGEALNLKNRFDVQFGPGPKDAWKRLCSISDLQVSFFTSESKSIDLIAYQSILVEVYKPSLNSKTLAAI